MSSSLDLEATAGNFWSSSSKRQGNVVFNKKILKKIGLSVFKKIVVVKVAKAQHGINPP